MGLCGGGDDPEEGGTDIPRMVFPVTIPTDIKRMWICLDLCAFRNN